MFITSNVVKCSQSPQSKLGERQKWTPAAGKLLHQQFSLQCLSPSVSRQQIYLSFIIYSALVAFWHHIDVAVVILSVWRTSIPVDGEPEVRGELQSPPGADREACGAVCQLTEDWPADGFPQWVLCSPQTTGTVGNQNGYISPSVSI